MTDLITLTESLGEALPKTLPNLILTKNVIKSRERRFFQFATKAHVESKLIAQAISKELEQHGVTCRENRIEFDSFRLIENDKTIGGVVITNTSKDNAGSALNQGILMSINDYNKE